MASVVQSVESAVRWRHHEILSDLEESPVPDRFRKKSSLDLRRSLRKRMPLRDVEINFAENPTWESLEAEEKRRNRRTLKRTAKSVFGKVSQKIQDSCQGPARTLVTSLAKLPSGSMRGAAKTRRPAPRTPRQKSGGPAGVSTPASGSRMVSPYGEGSPFEPDSCCLRKDLLPLRRSMRTAALQSPYGSPVSISQRKQFNWDLERVSSGIRRLKRLSQAFNDVIIQEEREQAIFNYYQAMARNMRDAQRRSRGVSRSNLWRRAASLRWTRTSRAVDSLLQY